MQDRKDTSSQYRTRQTRSDERHKQENQGCKIERTSEASIEPGRRDRTRDKKARKTMDARSEGQAKPVYNQAGEIGRGTNKARKTRDARSEGTSRQYRTRQARSDQGQKSQENHGRKIGRASKASIEPGRRDRTREKQSQENQGCKIGRTSKASIEKRQARSHGQTKPATRTTKRAPNHIIHYTLTLLRPSGIIRPKRIHPGIPPISPRRRRD